MYTYRRMASQCLHTYTDTISFYPATPMNGMHGMARHIYTLDTRIVVLYCYVYFVDRTNAHSFSLPFSASINIGFRPHASPIHLQQFQSFCIIV